MGEVEVRCGENYKNASITFHMVPKILWNYYCEKSQKENMFIIISRVDK